MALVDVLLPARGPAPWLRETLTGLQAQTLTDWRLVLVVHGPDEGITALAQSMGIPVEVVTADASLTFPEALNLGLAACDAEFVARIDSDDIPEPERLEVQVGFLNTHPECAAVGSSASLIDEEGVIVGHRRVPCSPREVLTRARWRNALIHPSATFRREAISGVGGYRLEALHVEDYDLWLRVLQRWSLAAVERPLLRYRIHPSQVTRTTRVDPCSVAAIRESRLALARVRGESALAARIRQVLWRLRQTKKN